MLGAAIVSIWHRCQKHSNTDFKFEVSIHAISQRTIFLNLPLFHFSWWIL